MPVMTEADARRVAVLLKQAARWRSEADAQDASGLAPGQFKRTSDQLRSGAQLADQAAAQTAEAARGKFALLAAYEPILKARVDEAVAAYAAGELDVAGLRGAFALTPEEACPGEYASSAFAAEEAMAATRYWRQVDEALGLRRSHAEDDVDDTPDPADIARLMEG